MTNLEEDWRELLRNTPSLRVTQSVSIVTERSAMDGDAAGHMLVSLARLHGPTDVRDAVEQAAAASQVSEADVEVEMPLRALLAWARDQSEYVIEGDYFVCCVGTQALLSYYGYRRLPRMAEGGEEIIGATVSVHFTPSSAQLCKLVERAAEVLARCEDEDEHADEA